MRKDPAIGTQLPAPPGPNLNAEIAAPRWETGPTVVVFIGPCSECNTSLLESWQQTPAGPPGTRVAIVTRDSPENVRWFLVQHPYPLAFYADPQGDCAARYNAAWSPRAYVLGKGRSLLWREGPLKASPTDVVGRLPSVVSREN